MAHIKVKDNVGPPLIEELARSVEVRAQQFATQRGVKAPKHVGYHGAFHSWLVFPYQSNEFRDCLLDAIKHYKLEVME